jgi:hypothetical protein
MHFYGSSVEDHLADSRRRISMMPNLELAYVDRQKEGKVWMASLGRYVLK